MLFNFFAARYAFPQDVCGIEGVPYILLGGGNFIDAAEFHFCFSFYKPVMLFNASNGVELDSLVNDGAVTV